MPSNSAQPATNHEQLARGLGWFSVGLGVAAILAPRSLSRTAGLRPHRLLLTAIGLRELACGVGILTQRRPAGWIQARASGDLMDLTMLGIALASNRPKKARIVAATAAVAGVTALDIYCAKNLRRGPRGRTASGAIHIEKVVTINRSPEELYHFWHSFENLPRFMDHLISVRHIGENRWHWVAQGPATFRVEWDAEITDDRLNERIAWHSLDPSDVDHSGEVRFERAPGGRGTVVRVRLDYRVPGGLLGARLAKLLGRAPEQQIDVDLRRFKQFMETGEIARTEGQPAGRSRSNSLKFDRPIRNDLAAK